MSPDDDDRLSPDGSGEIYVAPLEEALASLDTLPPPPAPPTGPELPPAGAEELPIAAGAAERALLAAFAELARVVRCCESLSAAVGRQLDSHARENR